MTQYQNSCPRSRKQVADLYFLEHRAKLIDVAAFLDRFERAGPADESDFRVRALEQAAAILTDGKPNRAKRVLEYFSDPTGEITQSAVDMKGALGAHDEGSA